MRLLLDTCVIVSGLRSDQGASRQLLIGALNRRFRMLVSVPLFLEYEMVLSREQQMDELGWELRDVEVFLDAIAAVGEPVGFSFLWRPALKDPADEMVLETAVNGGAELLVTHNTRDFLPAARFGIRVATPGEALANLRESLGEMR